MLRDAYTSVTVETSLSSKEKPFPRPFRVLSVAFPRPFRGLFRWRKRLRKGRNKCSGGCGFLSVLFVHAERTERGKNACNAKFSCNHTGMMQVTQNNGRTRPVPKACLGSLGLGAVMVGQKLVAVWWPVGQELADCGIEFRSRMVKASFSSKAEAFSSSFSFLFSASYRLLFSFFLSFSRHSSVDEKDAKRIYGKSMGCPILASNQKADGKKKRIEPEESSCNLKLLCKNTEMIQGGNASSVATLGGKVWTAF